MTCNHLRLASNILRRQDKGPDEEGIVTLTINECRIINMQNVRTKAPMKRGL